MEWKSIDVFYKLPLTCGCNVNYYKNVHHPTPTRGNREHPGNSQKKLVSSPFSWMSRCILFLTKLKGKGNPFLKGARRRATLLDQPQEHLIVIRNEKVSLFLKSEIVLPLLCFLLDPLTNQHCRIWGAMIKFWIDSFSFSFLQTLHGSSVLLKITPLYSSGSNVIYFSRKGPVEV